MTDEEPQIFEHEQAGEIERDADCQDRARPGSGIVRDPACEGPVAELPDAIISST